MIRSTIIIIKLRLKKLLKKCVIIQLFCFKVKNRGFIKKGYYADLVIFNLNNPWTVNKDNILYKCGWSPFEGKSFKSRISHTNCKWKVDI